MTIKATKKLITQPEDLWAAIDAARAETGQDRSSWLAEAAIARLPKIVAKGLSERPQRGRKAVER